MIAIGVDPGLAEYTCGMSRIDEARRTVLKAETLWLDPLDSLDSRMLDVTLRVSDSLMSADIIVIEDQQPEVHHARGRQNKSSAKLQGLVDQLKGAALVMSKPCLVLTPLQIRKIMGCKPDATKAMLARAARIQYRGLGPNVRVHAADAAVIAIAGARKWRRDEAVRTRRAVGS